jgi:hypothetical protein
MLWKTEMRRDLTRPPIGVRQLCVVARELLEHEPDMDDAAWREAIKCRIIALGYTYPPQPHAIPDAMARVERAVSRPVPVPPSPPTLPPTKRAPEWRPAAYEPRTDGQFTSLAELITAIKKRRRSSAA